MEPVSLVIAANFGGVPALGVGLLLLAGAWGWSENERRRSDRRLERLLQSESGEVRRYAVQSVADPRRHAARLLTYCLSERDPENLRLLAQHVKTCRWSRSQSLDWLTLRLWAFSYVPEDAVPGPGRVRRRPYRQIAPEPEIGASGASIDKGISPVASLIVDLAIVVGLVYATWIVGVRSGAFTGFPTGSDALSHLATIRLVLDNFPHLLWNYAWYGGFPAYPGSYPPFYTLAVAAGVAASGSSIVQAMDVATAAIYMVAVVSLYGFVRALGRSRLAAVGAAVILLGAPTLWSASLVSGSYPRLFAMAFIDLATLLAVWTTRRPTRPRIALTSLTLAIALGAHPVVGCIGVLQVAVVLLAVPRFPFERRLRLTAGVMSVVVGLSAWFYIPYVLRPHAYYLPAAQPALTTGTPAEVGSLVGIAGNRTLAALPAVLVPLTVLLGVAIVILMRRPRRARGQTVEETRGLPWRTRRERLSHPLGVAGACLIPVGCCLVYAYIDYIHGVRLTFNGVFPLQILTYAVWPLAGAFGIALGSVLSIARSRAPQLAVGAVVVAVAFGNLGLSAPLFKGASYTLDSSGTKRLIAALPKTQASLDERLAGTEDTETIWASAYTRTPNVRGGFAQGILNPGDQTALEDSLKEKSVPGAVRSFMIDWYGIEWIYAPIAAIGESLFGSQPGKYRLIETIPGTPERTYRVVHPTPILSATDAPTVLVIGVPEDYSLVLQDLARAGTPTAILIPVQGTQYIDDYSLADLEQFQSVVLYGFSAHSDAAAAKLLDAYVRQGGRLIVETAGNVPIVEQIAALAPGVFPVTDWGDMEIDRSWNFRAFSGPLTTGVPFTGFGPALYGSHPWLVEIAEQRAAGAKIVLEADGQAVVVEGRDGAGTVVMSGMNLPYHAAAFDNTSEADFLLGLIDGSYARPAAPAPSRYGVRFEGADAVEVDVRAGSVRGVLFKENDYPDWHATVDGTAAAIYPAGPGMMYVPLTDGAPVHVGIFYRLSAVEDASTGITLATLVLLALFVLIPKAIWDAVLSRLIPWRRRVPGDAQLRREPGEIGPEPG